MRKKHGPTILSPQDMENWPEVHAGAELILCQMNRCLTQAGSGLGKSSAPLEVRLAPGAKGFDPLGKVGAGEGGDLRLRLSFEKAVERQFIRP